MKGFGEIDVTDCPNGATSRARFWELDGEAIYSVTKLEASVQHCEAVARQYGCFCVHDANGLHLITGIPPLALEVLRDHLIIVMMIAPLGLGSDAAGACLAAQGIGPAIQVIAIHSEASPAGHSSWKQQDLVTTPNLSFAEGVATGSVAV